MLRLFCHRRLSQTMTLYACQEIIGTTTSDEVNWTQSHSSFGRIRSATFLSQLG